MGYRLGIRYKGEEDYAFYGTKHYGYFFNDAMDIKIEKLDVPSYWYLMELKKIDGDEWFDYGLDLEIELTAEEFKKWITLYAHEYQELTRKYNEEIHYEPINILTVPDIIKLINDPRNKILDWG